jgi:pyruvate/2-oxoglutarate dehydrogenase complex dihydrolipoamide acyltransferase (E2) component|tara:strand:- start:70 stop:297 length:228 start_codon:yes stop_codon:yes gene_type:complete
MEIIMPSLGETVDEGKVIKWHKNVGDQIKEGDILCEVETDKTAAEIPSTINGILIEITAPEGETIPVGGKIATVE